MVASTDASIAALPDLAAYVAALDPVVAAWAALPADKASVLDSATQAITDLSSQVTRARRPSPGRRHAHCTVLPRKLSLALRAACLTRCQPGDAKFVGPTRRAAGVCQGLCDMHGPAAPGAVPCSHARALHGFNSSAFPPRMLMRYLLLPWRVLAGPVTGTSAIKQPFRRPGQCERCVCSLSLTLRHALAGDQVGAIGCGQHHLADQRGGRVGGQRHGGQHQQHGGEIPACRAQIRPLVRSRRRAGRSAEARPPNGVPCLRVNAQRCRRMCAGRVVSAAANQLRVCVHVHWASMPPRQPLQHVK